MTQKPSESEEEYFARVEFEKRREITVKRARAMAADEARRLKETHWMRCPKCGHELITASLRGVNVETCHSCSGMWLDAGELDQVVASDDSGLLKKLRGIFGG